MGRGEGKEWYSVGGGDSVTQEWKVCKVSTTPASPTKHYQYLLSSRRCVVSEVCFLI